MSNVCTQCFADRELIAFINSQARSGDCDFCGGKNVACIPIEELFDFFAELLTHFKLNGNGTMLKSAIQGNWSLFSSLDSAYLILNDFLSDGHMPLSHADELVDFSDEIVENVGYWDQLKQQLVTKNRYITDVNYLTDELGWDGFFSSQIEIPKGNNCTGLAYNIITEKRLTLPRKCFVRPRHFLRQEGPILRAFPTSILATTLPQYSMKSERPISTKFPLALLR